MCCTAAVTAMLAATTTALTAQNTSPAEDMQRARSILAELVEINTTNSERGDTTAAARALERRLLDAGFPATDVHVLMPADAATKGNLVARYRGRNPSLKPILLLAHIDVVEALPEDWSVDLNPFEFLERGGYYYGRGVTDDKDEAAIYTANFIRMRREGFVPDRDIVDNSVTFKAASKTFSLAAIKVAWYFSTNPDLLERMKANTRTDVTTLGMVANHAGLTEGEAWLDQCRAYIDGNHDFVESYIRDRIPLLKYRKAQGTYLAWLDVSAVVERVGAKQMAAHESEASVSPVTPENVMQRWFAENARVYLNPGSSFGTGGAGHMRMNIGTPRRMLEHALDNLAAALERV